MNKIKKYWLCYSIAFLCLSFYFKQYSTIHNRVAVLWTQLDAISFLLFTLILGSFFVLLLFLYKFLTPTIKIIIDIAFIISLSCLVFSFIATNIPYLKSSYLYLFFSLMFFLIILSLAIDYSIPKRFLLVLCLIISPVMPIVLFENFTHLTYQREKGKLVYNKTEQIKNKGGKKNIYIFLFDEMSYEFLFSNKILFDEFKNLRALKESSVVFHNAYLHKVTEASISSLLFQTEKKGQAIKKDSQKSIFFGKDRNEYFKVCVGYVEPYIELVGKDVDYCRTFSLYNFFQENILGNMLSHIYRVVNMICYEGKMVFLSNQLGFFRNSYIYNVNQTIHKTALSVIRNSNRPTLCFFHYAVPHSPYNYTPTGDQSLYGYHDFTDIRLYANSLLYVDLLIGQLIKGLKENGKYEDSTIIVMSDHNWRIDIQCFLLWTKEKFKLEEKDLRKQLRVCELALPFKVNNKEGVCDVTKLQWDHIPLFIKLPGQKKEIEIDSKFKVWNMVELIEGIDKKDINRENIEKIIKQISN